MSDYFTLSERAFAEYVINKSRFIAYAAPVSSQQEALDFINEIKALRRDATHNVYAYMIKSPEYSRYSDDGEPQGSAGVPVLDVIRKNALTDCAIVVTRYFGGILLGAGGLVRAYSHSAKIAVDAAKIIKMTLCSVLEVCGDYSFYSKLSALIPESGGIIENTEFAERVKIIFRLPAEKEAEFSHSLTQASFGKISAKKLSEKYDAVDF